MTDFLLDEVQAGRFLGGDSKPISSRTLQRWRQEDSGPRWCRIGRLVRYRMSDLDAYLDANKMGPIPELDG